MSGKIVVGLQWSVEGKNKIVDLLAKEAGHIVRVQDQIKATPSLQPELLTIPPAILTSHAHCYIAGGSRIKPTLFLKEMRELISQGLPLHERLHISPYCRVSLSVNQGWANRIEMRCADLFRAGSIEGADWAEEAVNFAHQLRPYVRDVEGLLRQAISKDETLLLEGDGGALSDRIFGLDAEEKPVSALASDISAKAAVGPLSIEEVIGVFQPFALREEDGPLPTMLDPDTYHEFHEVYECRENARLGWLDIPMLRQAILINGVTQMALVDFDALDRLEEIKICVGYHFDGEELDRPPPAIGDFDRLEPVYETFPGWEVSTRDVRSIRGLPPNARQFVEAIEEMTHVPIGMISVGPAKEDSIEVDGEWV